MSATIDKPFYVYIHRRNDSGVIFYVGMGTLRRAGWPERALAKNNRGRYWQNIVNRVGFSAEIVGYFSDRDKCVQHEIALIKKYGRADLKKGTLVNLTNGGEAFGFGRKYTRAERKRRSERMRGKNHPNWGKTLSAETRARKSASMKASPHSLQGKKLPKWWRDRIAKTKVGKLNPMYGRTGALNVNSRKVFDTAKQRMYASVTEAAERNGMNMKSLYNMLTGHRANTSSLRFA